MSFWCFFGGFKKPQKVNNDLSCFGVKALGMRWWDLFTLFWDDYDYDALEKTHHEPTINITDVIQQFFALLTHIYVQAKHVLEALCIYVNDMTWTEDVTERGGLGLGNPANMSSTLQKFGGWWHVLHLRSLYVEGTVLQAYNF